MLGIWGLIQDLKKKRADVQATIRFLESEVGKAVHDSPRCPLEEFYDLVKKCDIENLKQLTRSVLRDRFELWPVAELRKHASKEGIPNASAYPKDLLISLLERRRKQDEDNKKRNQDDSPGTGI